MSTDATFGGSAATTYSSFSLTFCCYCSVAQTDVATAVLLLLLLVLVLVALLMHVLMIVAAP